MDSWQGVRMLNASDILGLFNPGIADHRPPSRTIFEYAAFLCSLSMLACCIAGLFGNAMSILIFTRPIMRSSINVLLTGLSLIDCSMLAVSIPVFVLPNFDMFFGGTLLPPSYLIVIIFGPYQLGMILQTASIFTLVLISFERYLAVCHPLKVSRILSVNRARIALIGVTVAAIGYNIVRFFEYGHVDTSTNWKDQVDQPTGQEEWAEAWAVEGAEEAAGTGPGPGPGAESVAEMEMVTVPILLRDEKFYFLFYHIALYLITHFLGPFLIISILNLLIWTSMRKSRTMRARLLPSRSLSIGCTSNRKLRRRTRTKTTQMIVVVTLMFLCCNILPFIVNIWEATTPDVFISHDPYLRATAYLVVDLSNTLVVFNSASTFLLYLLYCKKYRQLFRWYCLGPLRFLTGDTARFGGHYPVLLSQGSSSFDASYLGIMNQRKKSGAAGRERTVTEAVVSTTVVPLIPVSGRKSSNYLRIALNASHRYLYDPSSPAEDV